MQRDKVIFILNGKVQEVSGDEAFQTTSDFLRYQKGLTGTKVVCAEGDCGACTCLLFNPSLPEMGFVSFNSCITPVFNLDACFVITVEGIGTSKDLHPIQTSMLENHGAQCGFCTPGFICSMGAMVEDAKACGKSVISEKKAKNFLTGNLCRCTGYEPIIKSAVKLDLGLIPSLLDRYQVTSHLPFLESLKKQSVRVSAHNLQFFAPNTLEEAAKLKAEFPETRILAGSTDLGVLINKGKIQHQKVLSLANIQDCFQVKEVSGKLQVGARVSLSQLEKTLSSKIPELKKLLNIFASPQIKNLGTLVGNVLNASPIGDTIPAMLILNANLNLISFDGKLQTRKLNINELYLGYKQLNIKPQEIVTQIEFEIPNADCFQRLYKISVRKDLDISAVTMALLVQVKDSKIQDFRIAMGGVGPTVKRLVNFESRSQGQSLKPAELEKWAQEIAALLPKEISPLSDLRASKEYRLKVSQNLLQRFAKELLESDLV